MLFRKRNDIVNTHFLFYFAQLLVRMVPQEDKNRHYLGLTPGQKGMAMARKYIHYRKPYVYAIYYRSNNTIYINLDFKGTTQIIIFK